MKTYTTAELRQKYQEFMVENWVDNSHTDIGDEFCDYLDREEPEQPSTTLPECCYAGPCDYKHGPASTSDQDYGC
jgi:hypothetical protein